MYNLNTKTHCYHIPNGCTHKNGKGDNHKLFNSETALKAYDTSARLCGHCQRKREKQEKENQGR